MSDASGEGMDRSVMMLRIVKGVSLVLGAAIVATLVLIGYSLYTSDSKAPDANPQPQNAQTPVAVPAPLATLGDFSEIPLDQPVGSTIAGVTPQGSRLYVTVSGGGRPDRVVVVDLSQRRVVGTVTLDAGAPPRPAR